MKFKNARDVALEALSRGLMSPEEFWEVAKAFAEPEAEIKPAEQVLGKVLPSERVKQVTQPAPRPLHVPIATLEASLQTAGPAILDRKTTPDSPVVPASARELGVGPSSKETRLMPGKLHG